MKTNALYNYAFRFLVLSTMLVSCERDADEITARDKGDIGEEALVDSYYQDIDDLAGVALLAPSEAQYSGGRAKATITINDNRFQCDGIVVTIDPDGESTAEMPSGVITVNFGTGCTDLRGNVRKGKLNFVYHGRRFQAGSSVITIPDNYYINGVKLEGTRTTTNVTGSSVDAPKFTVVLTNGKATFEDGTFATRESSLTISWIRAANPLQDRLIIHDNSTASGITRDGKPYSVWLTQQLEYQRFCPIAVSGIKTYSLENKREITIDYGDGACDKVVTVKIGQITRTITIA